MFRRQVEKHNWKQRLVILYHTSNWIFGEMDDVVVLIETKQNYVDDDEKQLREYLEEERAIHPGNKAICVLANTNNDKIKVWKSFVDDEHVLKDEAMLDRMAHYVRLFRIK